MNHLKKLVPYLRNHMRQYVIGVLAVLVSNVAVLVGPYVVRLAIDAISAAFKAKADLPNLWMYALAIVASVLVSGGLMLLVRRQLVVASRQMDYEIRRDIFVNMTHLDKSFFDRSRTGDIMNRLTADLSAVREMLGFGAFQGASVISVFGASLVVMFNISPKLTWLVLTVIPVMIAVLAFLMRLIARRYVKAQEQSSLISAKAQENFSGVRVVKGYAIEEQEIKEYRAMNDELIRRNLKVTMVEGPLWAFLSMLMGIAYVLVLIYGGQMILRGQLTIGEFTQFTMTLERFTWPIMAAGMILTITQRGASSWERLLELLEAKPDIKDEGADQSIKSIKGDIEFRNVTVRYGNRTILKNLNLKIAAGQTLGITGATGSGKTILMQLVTRLIDATEGEVLVDGIPVKRIPLQVLRSHVGVVPQEPFLFSETVAQNVAFGVNTNNYPEIPTGVSVLKSSAPEKVEPVVDMQKVRWATDIAGLTSDIEGFPKGFDTEIGERGVSLSGGQKQRTALARAIAREPEVLILDDSMSAVDTETEARILSGLKKVMPGRTVMLVSHRVSTLRHADHIILLQHGEIIEQGSHEELVALRGEYAELERLQSLASDLENEKEVNA
ncbi:ABC transporter ATP-binding protein [Deinococcus roseus]|uniref:ABC transporter ATP-binding protein n=1 Tax=Deinococcus roseus TaxID=392414 RepID=A0ABQ2CVW4_9DEIO|nr:ABC transporter ATP-binding protein [Deinococcus roseus]GGJ22193.1 ABC transporter ATP-binding protein [Deinococcus roseus]